MELGFQELMSSLVAQDSELLLVGSLTINHPTSRSSFVLVDGQLREGSSCVCVGGHSFGRRVVEWREGISGGLVPVNPFFFLLQLW